MKVFAYKKLAHVADRALRYSLALPLTTVVTGCSKVSELEANLAVAEHFSPMTRAERLAFFREVLPLVSPANQPWKTAEWGISTAWKPRREPSGLAVWGD